MTVQRPERPDPNAPIIEEFRANGGRVGGYFEGAPLLLLTTTGRRSGREHTNPTGYLRVGDQLLIFATNAGRDRHPDWFHNLAAAPEVGIEIGDGEGGVTAYPAIAEVLDGDERDRMYAAQVEADPSFGAYEEKTDRTIPVVRLRAVRGADLGGPEQLRAIGDFLVQVHAGLRAEFKALRDDTAAEPAGIGDELARRCFGFCAMLHGHHSNEGAAFDAIEERFPHLGPDIARLKTEHQAIAKAISELQARAGSAEPDGAAELGAELDRIEASLLEHFAYEEATIVATLRGERPAEQA